MVFGQNCQGVALIIFFLGGGGIRIPSSPFPPVRICGKDLTYKNRSIQLNAYQQNFLPVRERR